ncbi:hypothetical protein M9Y10_006591 [Tritrichomonas musculus]|uniref:Uncharacterized protein n=1 Tax=Tritrichomonas musculus TaxID=1915356 RepID=A0ABR2JEL3_9EUKA
MSDEDSSQNQQEKITEDELSEKRKVNEISDEDSSQQTEEETSEKSKVNENSDEDSSQDQQMKITEDESDRINQNSNDEMTNESSDKKETEDSTNVEDDDQNNVQNSESSERKDSSQNYYNNNPYEQAESDGSNSAPSYHLNDQTNEKYTPTTNNNKDDINPYVLKDESDSQKDPENITARSVELEEKEKEKEEEKEKDDDDDISISSESIKDQIPRAISTDDIVTIEQPNEPGENVDFDNLPFLEKFKWPLISSAITLVFIIITSAVAGGVKKDVRMHIIEKTLEIVNKIGGYVIWGFHCIGLLALPFLFVILFGEKVKIYQIWGPPIMMLLNMIGGFLPIKGSFFPLIIELLMTIYYLFHLPFKPVYLPKNKDFWPGELTLMFLTFIYISAALGSSTLSYLLYGSYIRAQNYFISGPSNPHYAIAWIEALNSLGYYKLKVQGGYLACYSLFTFLSVGIGFAMSMKNSILMIVPYLMLAICTVIETRGIGILLFGQLLIHVIYIIFLHFHTTRKFITGTVCNCCLECCYATLTTIMIGDIIGFSLVAFPILQLSIYKDGPKKFNWGGFIGGSLVIFIGIIFHYMYSCVSCWYQLLFACAGFFSGALIFGLTFAGYAPLIRAFTYEITYVTWSFALCFWGYSSGYSPALFKAYNGLISLASLVMIELYEGIGWMEIVFAVIQVFFDTVVITYVQRISTKYIAWTVFSVAGIVCFGFLVGVAVIICAIIAFFILSKICAFCSDWVAYSQAYDIAQGLKKGDTFECAGRTWVVT